MNMAAPCSSGTARAPGRWLNADAHKALGDRIEANGKTIPRVEGKVDTLIEMTRPRA